MTTGHRAGCAELMVVVRRLLAHFGPLDTDDVANALAEGGFVDDDEVDEVVEHLIESHAGLVAVGDDRVADLAILLGDRTLTHMLTADEVEAGAVLLHPDLAALAGAEEVDGGPVTGAGEPVTHVHLPPAPGGGGGSPKVLDRTRCGWAGTVGWLEGFSPGDLVAVRVTNGWIELTKAVDPAPAPSGWPEQVAAAFDALGEGDGFPIDIEELFLHLLAGDPALLTGPSLPVGELLVAAGFEVRGNVTGPQGVDWAGFDELAATIDLIVDYRLSAAAIRAVRSALAHLGGDEKAELASVVAAL
ncbi:MAG: hypothetical protein ACRD0F_02325, partial [Acidimicrobiales bacterium]